MADIRIEKKKPIWPWLLLVIVLAVVAFLYFYGSTGSDEDDMQNTDIEEVSTVEISQNLHNEDGLRT